MTPVRLSAAVSLVVVSLAAEPGIAQSPSGPEMRLPQKLDDALRELMDRVKPAFDDVLDMLGFFEKVDGLENYEPPEFSPNGDIIIRRREDAPVWEPPAGIDYGKDGVKT